MEQKPAKPYKQLKQKQKAKISDYMYLETQAFWLANQRMPSTDSEWQAVAQKVYDHIASFHVTYEEVCSVYLKKLPHIIERLEADGLPGHIRSHAEVKELQRVRAAKKAGNPRKKRAKKAAKAEPLEQDDTFFFIAGYLPFDTILIQFLKNLRCVFRGLGYYLILLSGLLGGYRALILLPHDKNTNKNSQTAAAKKGVAVLTLVLKLFSFSASRI